MNEKPSDTEISITLPNDSNWTQRITNIIEATEYFFEGETFDSWMNSNHKLFYGDQKKRFAHLKKCQRTKTRWLYLSNGKHVSANSVDGFVDEGSISIIGKTPGLESYLFSSQSYFLIWNGIYMRHF